MACLDHRRRAVEALVDVFARADEEVVTHATKATFSLPKLAACDDLETLRLDVPVPDDPKLATEVETLRDSLARASVLNAAGHDREALEWVEQSLPAATDSDYKPVQAEFHELLGELHRARSDPQRAIEHRSKALILALASSHRLVAGWATVDMIFDLGYLMSDREAGEALVDAPIARVAAAGNPLDMQARLLQNRGVLFGMQDRHDLGLPLFEKALRTLQRSTKKPTPELATAMLNLALTYSYQRQFLDSDQLLRQSLEVGKKALGASHPTLSRTYGNLGENQSFLGQFAAARETLARSWELCEANAGVQHISCAELQLDAVVLAHLSLEDFDAGIAIATRAMRAQTEAGHRGHPEAPWARVVLAGLHLGAGRIDVARALAREGLDQTESETHVFSRPHSRALRTLAQVEIAAGNPGCALELLADAHRVLDLDIGPKIPTERHRVSGAMGDALSSDGRPREALGRHRAALRQAAAFYGERNDGEGVPLKPGRQRWWNEIDRSEQTEKGQQRSLVAWRRDATSAATTSEPAASFACCRAGPPATRN